jgi:hypothetical protein
MTPFFDCLSRHGVQPSPLTGTSLHGSGIRDPRLVQKEIHAKITCVPQLPEQLRAAGERFKQRFQQLYR